MTSSSSAAGARRFAAGLPDLAGRWLTTYRIFWASVLAGALIVQASEVVGAEQEAAFAVLGLVQGAVLIAVATLLFRRRPRDPVAAMLSLAFLIWAITGAAEGEDGWSAALDRLRFLLLVGAVLLFPTGRFEPRWTALALAATGLVFLVGIAGAAGIVPETLFLPPAVLCVVAAIAALLARLHRAPPCAQRQQLKWVAFGLAAGLLLVLVNRIGTALGPTSASALLLDAAFRCGVISMALGFLVSLLRYRLYDAEAAISRSAAYVALTLALVAIFAASEATIELIGQRYLGMRVGDLAGGIAAAIAAVLIAPLHERLSRWAEQHFQRDLVALRAALPRLLADVREHADFAALSAIVLPALEAGVRSTHAALAVDGAIVAVSDMAESAARAWLDSWRSPATARLDRDPDDAVFPLRIALTDPSGSIFGWALLGPRPDGSFYRRDELEALAEVAVPLRRAIAAARRRERHAAQAREARDALLRALAALAERVSDLEAAAVGARG